MPGILASLVLIASTFLHIDKPPRFTLPTPFFLLAVTTIATIVGAFVPLGLNPLRFDPTAATGAFVAASNDVVGSWLNF